MSEAVQPSIFVTSYIISTSPSPATEGSNIPFASTPFPLQVPPWGLPTNWNGASVEQTASTGVIETSGKPFIVTVNGLTV